MSHVTCHMSHVTCHMSHVTCHMSHVICHLRESKHVFQVKRTHRERAAFDCNGHGAAKVAAEELYFLKGFMVMFEGEMVPAKELGIGGG